MAYDYKRMGEMKPKKSFLFVYMRFVKVTDNLYHRESVKVHCKDTFGHERYFYCDKAKFWEVYESVRFENKEKQTLVIGGFVYKAFEKSSILTFSSLCMFVTNKLGLYSESSYELETYDKLCDAKRVFYKPYFSLPEYDDLKPDILFLDTNPPVIGEIFGFDSQEYLEERARKLKVADELKENYGFWKWDAYEKEPFPEFPVAYHPLGRAALSSPLVLASSTCVPSPTKQEEDVRLETKLQLSQQAYTTMQLAQEWRADTLRQTSAQAKPATPQQPFIWEQSAQTQQVPYPPVSNQGVTQAGGDHRAEQGHLSADTGECLPLRLGCL